MPAIRVKENEPFEVAMRRFKRAACPRSLRKADYRTQTQKSSRSETPAKTPAQPTASPENVLIGSDRLQACPVIDAAHRRLCSAVCFSFRPTEHFRKAI